MATVNSTSYSSPTSHVLLQIWDRQLHPASTHQIQPQSWWSNSPILLKQEWWDTSRMEVNVSKTTEMLVIFSRELVVATTTMIHPRHHPQQPTEDPRSWSGAAEGCAYPDPENRTPVTQNVLLTSIQKVLTFTMRVHHHILQDRNRWVNIMKVCLRFLFNTWALTMISSVCHTHLKAIVQWWHFKCPHRGTCRYRKLQRQDGRFTPRAGLEITEWSLNPAKMNHT